MEIIHDTIPLDTKFEISTTNFLKYIKTEFSSLWERIFFCVSTNVHKTDLITVFNMS